MRLREQVHHGKWHPRRLEQLSLTLLQMMLYHLLLMLRPSQATLPRLLPLGKKQRTHGTKAALWHNPLPRLQLQAKVEHHTTTCMHLGGQANALTATW
jgi:hypothetical protein